MLDTETTCTYDIPGYGICGKPANHVVHKILGMSPREHLYQRPDKGKMETVELTSDTLDRVAHRSGRRKEDLIAILAVGDIKNERIKVQYEVVNDSEPTEEGETNGDSNEAGATSDADVILPEV